MQQEDPIVNKVAQSGIVTLNLEDFYPDDTELWVFDLKEILFQEAVLRERDLREYLKNLSTVSLFDKYVWITCSADAIIPTWAFMLVSVTVHGHSKGVFFSESKTSFLHEVIKQKLIEKLNIKELEGKRVVIKGCSHKPVPTSVFVYVAALLKPVVKSLMFGEPCSTVPLFKKKD